MAFTFPGSRAEAVSYQFRVTWYGEDFIRHEVRFDTPLPEDTPFSAWDSQKDRLCGAIEAALTTNRRELERFLGDLRRELEASPQFPPSPDDVLWRMIH